jgi:hypothetical protein
LISQDNGVNAQIWLTMAGFKGIMAGQKWLVL